MKVQWKFIRAEDPSQEDNSTELWVDGKDTGIAIQHSLYGRTFLVAEIEEEPEWVSIHRGEFKTLVEAKANAWHIYKKRVETGA